MNLTEKQIEVIKAHGHILITGGPGSGKTTVSILKAANIIDLYLRPGQKVLFLSFARATVSRVIEVIEYEQKISSSKKQRIDVETYHSFFWRILKTHGYLIGLPRRLSIITPSHEGIALSKIRADFKKLKDEEKQREEIANEHDRLAKTEGRICFDLFARYVNYILRSQRICRLIATMYPVIILDEFQDTNTLQWHVIQALGSFCQLIALADPKQRIYDWIGADPKRLDHFREAFTPTEIDFNIDNHRNAGTEIMSFGNNILTGIFNQKEYKGVNIDFFDPYHNLAMTKLITTVYSAHSRLAVKRNVKDWSLAVLVPTKKMTRMVSNALRQPPAGMAVIPHFAAIEMEAAILGAEVIAHLLQPSIDNSHFQQFITLVCNYFQGKGGEEPSRKALKEANRIWKAYEKFVGCQTKGQSFHKNSILVNMRSVYDQTRLLGFTGIPDKDWQAIQCLLEKGICKRLKEIANEVSNVHILERGSQLRQALSHSWRDNGKYTNALHIIRQAFIQEHFSISSKPESGVIVMNMHKAKGKQFDEVIIFEGWPTLKKGQIIANLHRIVRYNDRDKLNDQTRQNFRVSLTRAKQQVTILTPRRNPCIILQGLINQCSIK